jgi:hypothetical protein
MNKKNITLILSVFGLILIFLVSVFYAWNQINFRNFKILLLIGTFLWFSGIIITNRMKKDDIK